ncbi:Hypothetical predicted protein [Cloeon dipterum]|uniref:RNA methyltransferase n=1 Tax=Cloeon dipterum TaxID=197152 RepID=A0A8S1C5D0_9INSE|nr:Hypothetical predicted protein [Cloeon dipterum]
MEEIVVHFGRLMNAVTPKSSPLPTPKHRREKIEVPELDPTDPLMLLAPPMSSIKKRKRKRKASSPVGPNAKEAKLSEMPPTDSTGRPLKLSLMRKSLSNRTISEIVSPVVPQPGEWRRKVHKKIVTASIIAAAIDKKHSSYRYGNYDRYYGYRVKKYGPEDPRLSLLGPERFEGKDVLDIGCNSGELTIAMALFGAKSVVGVDIDADLINQAIKNQRLFLAGERSIVLDEKKELELRASKPTLKNLIFVSGDYVLKEDCMVDEQKQHFDVITCLSVTKWIQLNHGDAGLKRAFRRMFAQLRPGGVLYLEPQPYSSYTLKKNVTSQTLENYKKMKFYPESFPEFLLQTVGFSALDVVGTPSHMSNGFQREIFKFTKPPDAKKKG